MAAKIYRINYKSDFILTLHSDAGWMTPFCIKFWTGAPSQAFYAQGDGTTYTHCSYDPSEPTKLTVQFDDHHLPIGDLKYQVAYHFTVEDFPNDTEDEVLNQADITTEIDGEEYQVMLDFTGETAPEIQFSLPAYANEVQRIANEQQRIANEEQRIADEQTRVSNEENRINQEQTRQTNEAQRIRNEQTRINQEEARVREFATLKHNAQEATTAANDAAALANQKAQLAADKAHLAADKAALAQDAANLANEKAQLAADKAALANDAAALANEKAALAQQKAEYAKDQGDYAKQQGDYAKEQGDYAKQKGDDAATQMQQQAQAFSEAQAARQTAYEQAEGTESGSVAGDGSRWGTFKTNEAARDAQTAELQTKLEEGEVVPALAKDIESWHNSNSKVVDTQTDAVFTAGGNESVNSNEAARIISLVPGSLTAGAASLVSTGFNLLRNATQIGSGQVWYFPVPYLRYGTFGTADENNGMLFTDSDQNNMTPTVYWKALSAGVPTSATDGVAAGYTDFGGYRFYTTPSGHEGEVGYFIVQATRATTCAHIAWSGRYDEYIAVDNASDAGASLALTAILNNLHNNGLMYKVGDVVDSIAFTTTSAVWTRNCDRKQGSDLEWTNTLQEEEGTYLHTATIADMKEDGAMVCTNEGIALVVSGKEVSYTDSNATAFTADYIYYELATPVTGTVSGTFSFIIEDWGVIYFTGVTGTVVSIIEYSQNIIDTLRKLATTGINDAMRVIAESLNQLAAENERLKIYAERLEARIEALESNA